jgi:hypothetical protein
MICADCRRAIEDRDPFALFNAIVVPPEQCALPLHRKLAVALRENDRLKQEVVDLRVDLQEARRLLPHMNERGSGASYGVDPKRPPWSECVQVLAGMRASGTQAQPCSNYDTGLTTDQVWFEVNALRKARGEPPVKDSHSMGGRLSELQSKETGRIVQSQTNRVRLPDGEHWRFESENRWFLTGGFEATDEEILSQGAEKEFPAAEVVVKP